jgi:hypothetical protein
MTKRMFCVVGALLALSATGASAQPYINLSGQFVCVQGCVTTAPGALAFVTQNGWDVNLTNEVGASSRAWIDWPGHMWVDNWGEGAIYSPDGNTIQFNSGAVWQRFIPPPPPPLLPPRYHRVHR